MKNPMPLFLLLLGLAARPGHAASMFYESCGDRQASVARIFLASDRAAFAGLSCQDLKSAVEATQVLSMALLPVSVALRTPGAREEIAASLASYGLTLANPAVLGITVLGAAGVVTIYFVMKHSLDECERQDREQLRQDLLQDLKRSFPGMSDAGAPLEIQPEEGGA